MNKNSCMYCDNKDSTCIHSRLIAFSEYAEATKKFHDLDFYNQCLKYIIELERINRFRELELHVKNVRVDMLEEELEMINYHT